MTSPRPVKRPQIVGVIASPAELDCAVRIRRKPDFFELRLDRLVAVADTVETLLPKLRAPLIITARHPREGGSGNLGLRQRRDLLARFLRQASYIDVELRSADALRSFLELAENEKVGRIISYHNFQSTPNPRILAVKAREAKSYGAVIFKVATRTDTAIELGRLLEFAANNRVDLALAVMGIGKLGAISRVMLARAGSIMIYASLNATTDIKGQLSLEQLRTLGIGRRP